MEATTKARPSARREASDITAVIKATERAGTCTLLSVKRRGPTSVKRIAMVCVGVVKAVVVEVAVVEVIPTGVVAIDDRSAMGDVGIVIVDH